MRRTAIQSQKERVTPTKGQRQWKWRVASGTDLEDRSIGWERFKVWICWIAQNGQWPVMGGNGGCPDGPLICHPQPWDSGT